MTSQPGASPPRRADTDAVCDACVFINLWATGRVDEILVANQLRIMVPEQVATECRMEPGSTDLIVGEPRRCAELIERGRLRVVTLGDNEVESYVQLGRELDDGEAAALAYAAVRSTTLLTDERKAIRIVSERFPQVAVIRTAALVRRWSGQVAASAVAAVLRAIEEDASYLPNASDPDRDWWFAVRER